MKMKFITFDDLVLVEENVYSYEISEPACYSLMITSPSFPPDAKVIPIVRESMNNELFILGNGWTLTGSEIFGSSDEYLEHFTFVYASIPFDLYSEFLTGEESEELLSELRSIFVASLGFLSPVRDIS